MSLIIGLSWNILDKNVSCYFINEDTRQNEVRYLAKVTSNKTEKSRLGGFNFPEEMNHLGNLVTEPIPGPIPISGRMGQVDCVRGELRIHLEWCCPGDSDVGDQQGQFGEHWLGLGDSAPCIGIVQETMGAQADPFLPTPCPALLCSCS